MFRNAFSILVLVFTFSTITQADDSKPEVLAVLFYADWCNSCKVLEPQIEKARAEAELDTDQILFVTLDLTDDTTKHQAAFLASQLGVSEFYAENEGATGFLLLVDAESKEVLTRITKTSDAEAITSIIRKAITHVSS